MLTLLQDLLVATQKEDLHSVRVVQQTFVMLTQTLKLCTNLVAFGNLRGSPVRILKRGTHHTQHHIRTPLCSPSPTHGMWVCIT